MWRCLSIRSQLGVLGISSPSKVRERGKLNLGRRHGVFSCAGSSMVFCRLLQPHMLGHLTCLELSKVTGNKLFSSRSQVWAPHIDYGILLLETELSIQPQCAPSSSPLDFSTAHLFLLLLKGSLGPCQARAFSQGISCMALRFEHEWLLFSFCRTELNL